MSIPPYSLSCSVCQGVYISKTEWLDHLTTPKHLILARDDIVDECKMEQNGIKECCLLVFSNTPLTLSSGGGAEKLIRYFSSDPTTFVTDFVWWRDRPRFGILQFESRKKALEVQGGCTKFLIDSTEAEVKWAGALSKVEWRAYLPEGDAAGAGSTPKMRTSAANNGKENYKPNSTGNTSAGSSLIRDDTAHQDNQMTEISVASRPKTKMSENPKTAIIRLRRFARRRQGINPQYVYHRLLNNPHGKHLFRVIINEEKYKPSAQVAAGESKMDAKLKAAMYTLKKLRLSTASKKLKENSAGAGSTSSAQDHPSPTKNEMKATKRRLESDDEIQQMEVESRQLPKKLKTCANVPVYYPGGKSPISLLNELTQRNKWPAPAFKCQKEGKGTAQVFSYSVKVNGVMYKPDSSIPKVGTMKKAKHLIAEFCWKKLTSSMKPADSESVVKSKAATNLKLALRDTSIQNTNLSSVPDSLEYDLQCVKNTVTISDAEFRMALEAVHALESLFITKDRTSQVVMFRNWHLKLRNPNCSENNELLVYVYKTRPLKGVPNSFSWFSDATVQCTFRMSTARKSFEVLEVAINGSSSGEAALQNIGWKVKFKPYNLNFRLIADRKCFVEVQIYRLVEYMCTFDPVCHSVIALAYHWAMANSVCDGKFTSSKHLHLSLPDPLTLEWLVIVFLCQKGIIPSPRQIQERPHDILKERLDGPDIGFHADPEFVKEWKSKRSIKSGQSMDELELFQQFLHFYGESLSKGDWIINTRDGEVLRMCSFLSCEPNQKSLSSLQTKMSLEEFMELRSLQQKPPLSADETSTGTAEGNMPTCAYKVNFSQWKLYMVHPFKFTWKFSMSKDIDIRYTLDLMNGSEHDLKKYLHIRKHNGVKEAKKRFGSLEKVLKVVDE